MRNLTVYRNKPKSFFFVPFLGWLKERNEKKVERARQEREDTVRVRHIREHRTPNDIYIGRPSPWGNPFPLRSESERGACLERFRVWAQFSGDPRAVWIRAHVHELRGKNLVCFCAPKACHGDILAAMAERSLA